MRCTCAHASAERLHSGWKHCSRVAYVDFVWTQLCWMVFDTYIHVKLHSCLGSQTLRIITKMFALFWPFSAPLPLHFRSPEFMATCSLMRRPMASKVPPTLRIGFANTALNSVGKLRHSFDQHTLLLHITDPEHSDWAMKCTLDCTALQLLQACRLTLQWNEAGSLSQQGQRLHLDQLLD